MKKLFSAAAGVLLLLHAQLAIGDQDAAVVAAQIQSQLELRYPLAGTTPDSTDIISAGAVLVLQKDNLVMNRVYIAGTQLSRPSENIYEKGEITQPGFMGGLNKLNSILGSLGNTESPSRAFDHGERFWVTRILTQADGIEFRLMSDAINNARYHAFLKFPYVNSLSAEQMVLLVADVLKTDPPFVEGSETQAQETSTPETSPASSASSESDEIRRAAEAGDVSAMYQAGNMAAQQGANVDAARWFRSASDRGHVKATNALGFLYEEGKGVPQNYAQANNLYLRAMKQGNADAMVNRGLMYANGLGMAKDSVQAYMHFLLGAAYAQDQDTRDVVVKLRNDTAAKLSKQQQTRGQVLADKFAQREIK